VGWLGGGASARKFLTSEHNNISTSRIDTSMAFFTSSQS
jgi:hypothetical protein